VLKLSTFLDPQNLNTEDAENSESTKGHEWCDGFSLESGGHRGVFSEKIAIIANK